MAEYKKYLFDNFIISEDKPAAAEPEEEPVVEVEAEQISIPQEDIVEKEPEPAEEVVPIFAPSISEVTPAEPEVSYSQDELDAASREAEEKGYERGYNNAVSEHEKAETLLLDGINNRLMTILADANTQNAEQEQNALRFALSLVKKILPSLEEQVAAQEIEAFMSENFKNFADQSSLSFRFHPDIAATVAPKISRLAEQNDFEGKIAIHKDSDLALSDCRIEWQNGGVERNRQQMISAVENMLK